ncbi:GNAT family N-acetyltransferase [Actinoplanes sp. TBRC 11911]|uniref:GNAT family N-acetyltransferase n=1 Tax=Actinoplanes sp. TBRC 11911 TaxID=2729386 RepID=UPI0028A00F14|nr:GNAT family N-acetyltransferase [Actinoplanes sp. TBRC 11911]
MSPFYALADTADPQAWADAAVLAEPGEAIFVPHGPRTAPPGWEMTFRGEAVQFVGNDVDPGDHPEPIVLTTADVPEMIDLVRRTDPGPFLSRTIELGRYVGIRRRGALVAMAGERMRPSGWSEISAVCTDPAYRGQGLASGLVGSVIAAIDARGEVPFLHVKGDHPEAIGLYHKMGFTERKRCIFGIYRPIGQPWNAAASAGR